MAHRTVHSDVGAADILRCLPRAWVNALGSGELVPVATGMSGADVYRIRARGAPDRFLKVVRGESAAALSREIERTTWLGARSIRVPSILMSFVGVDLAAAIMSRVPGAPLAASGCAPLAGVRAIARELRRLHRLPAADCPFDESTHTRLLRATEAIERGLVDSRDFDARNRMLPPHELYGRLAAAVPEPEDLVVVHGDATLDNILMDSLGQVGFIDCGHCGRGDRYVDLAIVTEQIEAEFGWDSIRIFLDAYGDMEWDEAKARFFRDLYEFF
jgi:aminoglycoside 3'-phosphotransferase II